MLNRRVRIAALSLAVSLVIGGLSTGCGMVGQEETPVQTETQKQSEKVTEKVPEPATEKETEKETEMKTNVAYTSQDKTIRITLPDSTWKVTQDVDEMRVFSSGNAAMINIVHAADASAMKKLSVATSENALKESLTKQYPDANAFEVVEFEKLSSATLDTYEYVVKYNATSMWAYSVTYGIMGKNEAYVITGTVLEANKVLLDAVQKSVESFTVLRNGTFSALPGTVVNKNSESQTQSESGNSADNELKTLTEYGAGTDLYASELVNIRQQPSTEANKIGSLQKGDKVTVVGETSQWFKVNINGNIGYINKAYLVYNPPADQSETTQTDSQVSDSTKITAELNSYVDYGAGYTYYTTTDVNLRVQPGTSSGVVSTVNGGTEVSVIGETDNWFVVSVNGSTGYISKTYISASDPGSSGGNGNGNGDGNGGNGNGGGQTSGTGTISGTVVEAGTNTITVQGDDGNTYTINYTDASLNTSNGLYSGLYITATVDYSGTSPTGDLYATSVSGH